MEEFFNLFMAALCGGLVGMEREMRHKPAGLRTNMLIALGSALFTEASILMADKHWDPARIAAQIATGVGFLGAGAIIRQGRDTVTGLTSAATVWVVAALGMLAGANHSGLAFVGTLLTIGILSLIDQLEMRLADKYDRCLLRLEFQAGEGVGNAIRRALRRHRVRLESIDAHPQAGHKASMVVVYSTSTPGRERLLADLGRIDGVLQVTDTSE